jgi:RNA-dependent RNA polymerase
MRQDAISAMRRDSTALCDEVRQGIEGPEGTSNEDQILRAWTAWKVSIAFTEAFGTKSFGLLALDVMFSAMRAIDALDTASSRR